MLQTTFTPTEARQNFFQLLRMVELGKDITIVRPSNPETEIKLTVKKKNQKKDLVTIAKDMGKIGFPSMSVGKIRKIILSKNDVKS